LSLHGLMEIDNAGHLIIGGCDTVKLAKEFGTPLYIFDEQSIRNTCRLYKNEFESRYEKVKVLYASKAFMTKAMAMLVDQEGLSIDVCSPGEIYTCLQAGVNAEKLYFHGNNKTEEDVKFALNVGIGRFMVDNEMELEMLDRVAGGLGKKAHIIMRLTPGIEAHTHDYVKTGQIDSKFGVVICNGAAMRAVKYALSLKNIELEGLHCHIGSQIFDIDQPYDDAARIMLGFANEVKNETGWIIKQLDLGGGLGIKYNDQDNPKSIEKLAEVITDAVKRYSSELSMELPELLLEPGRSMVGEWGTTLYTVGGIKDIPGIRKYVSIDGGMTDNPRVALYQAQYDAVIANKANCKPTEVVTVAGKACESGDIILYNINLPEIEREDIIAVFSTGAYNYSMSSNYNRHQRPAVVFVKDGEARLVVKRESLDDLVKNDIIPDDFKVE